ncbi:MAG TPA: formate dehydrogenase accessory sulfurtransferase FdhD [Methanocorpusculum sp.]|nr:formate dehydrogenase accessory sulfurtransferase FdhD [Methanocorpusculum sp.]HJJ40346.1 formate dehydrogenase accessory sulfurtransferase FdhD [Methanocorpusculum sp.]HJJ49737.1 formate dehydrogenase accessory sulfurtransferase FdhD [Methanocorpusculum sp.]HJJ57569.1 formate dehydrogenase accessory sulfurtransferase FdhD [Methanocorpusculum sp.]
MHQESIKTVAAVRYRDGTVEQIEDQIIVEDTFNLYLNGTKYLSLVASRDSLEELGAGFFIAAGIAKRIRDVKTEGQDIFVTAEEITKKNSALESAGGIDTGIPDVSVSGTVTVTPEEIFTIRASLNSEVWEKTGGLHCTALYHKGKVAGLFSDIGRHNTVDKAVGFMVLHNFDPSECIIGCTGRQPKGMVAKAANAGIPIVISRAAATTAGIETAENTGVTLVCFTRDRWFTVYTHPERISGIVYP